MNRKKREEELEKDQRGELERTEEKYEKSGRGEEKKRSKRRCEELNFKNM